MKSTPLFLAYLFGCSPEEQRDQGTVVGNPGDAALRMGAVNDGEVISARTHLAGISLETCNGAVTEFPIDEEVDFFDDVRIDLPNGEWCGLQLFSEESLYIETVSSDEEIFLVLDLEIETLEFSAADGFEIEGDKAILEWGFPGWLSMDGESLFDRLDIDQEERAAMEEAGEEMVFEVTSEDGDLHDELVDVFAYGSGLYGDDGDGRLSEEERSDSLWAAGSDHPVESTEENEEDEAPMVEPTETRGANAQLATGPGCAKSESNLQWVGFFPLILAGWRRRLGPH